MVTLFSPLSRLNPASPEPLPNFPSLPIAPPHTLSHKTHQLQETRIYLLTWTWQAENAAISSARLRLIPEEASNLRQRFTLLRRAQDILAFAIEEEPSDTLTYPEFLQNTPALWAEHLQNPDTSIDPLTP